MIARIIVIIIIEPCAVMIARRSADIKIYFFAKSAIHVLHVLAEAQNEAMLWKENNRVLADECAQVRRDNFVHLARIKVSLPQCRVADL